MNKEHKNLLRTPKGKDITQIQQREFPKWFKERVRHYKFYNLLNNLKDVYSLIITDVIKLLYLACCYR